MMALGFRRFDAVPPPKIFIPTARPLFTFPLPSSFPSDDDDDHDDGQHLALSTSLSSLLLQPHLHTDSSTLASLLHRCAFASSFHCGSRIHAIVCLKGLDQDLFIRNHLVHMYGKCRAMEEAWSVFLATSHRNVFSWNIIVGLLAECHSGEAFDLFEQMLMEGVIPDKVTFVNLLSSYASMEVVKRLHASLVSAGLESNVVVGTALVTIYRNLGNIKFSKVVFDHMPSRNVVTWSAMISAHAQHNQCEAALQLLSSMELQGIVPKKMTVVSGLSACANLAAQSVSYELHTRTVLSGFETNTFIGTALIDTYGKCGSLINAEAVFSMMVARNALSWTAMMAAYGMHGRSNEMLSLFQKMQLEGILPDDVSFLCLLSACSHLGMLDEVCILFESMNREYGIQPKLEHFNCLVDLFGRMGMLDQGQVIIEAMPCQASDGTWLSLLAACRMHFDVDRAERTALCVVKLDPLNAAPHLLLSRIHNWSVLDSCNIGLE